MAAALQPGISKKIVQFPKLYISKYFKMHPILRQVATVDHKMKALYFLETSTG